MLIFFNVHIIDFIEFYLTASEGKYDGLLSLGKGTRNDVYWIASLSITGHLANTALAVTLQSVIKETLPPLWGPRSLFDTWHPVQRASPARKSKNTLPQLPRSVSPVVSPRSTAGPSPHCPAFIFLFPTLFKSQIRVSVREANVEEEVSIHLIP